MNKFRVIVAKVFGFFTGSEYQMNVGLVYPDGKTHELICSVKEFLTERYAVDAVLICENKPDGEGEVVEILKSTTHLPIEHLPKMCGHCGKETLEWNEATPTCTNVNCITNEAARLQKAAKRFKVNLFGGMTGIKLLNCLNATNIVEVVKSVNDILAKGEKLTDYEGIGDQTAKNLMTFVKGVKFISTRKTFDPVDFCVMLCIPGMTKAAWEKILDVLDLDAINFTNKHQDATLRGRFGKVDPKYVEIFLKYRHIIVKELDLRVIC